MFAGKTQPLVSTYAYELALKEKTNRHTELIHILNHAHNQYQHFPTPWIELMAKPLYL